MGQLTPVLHRVSSSTAAVAASAEVAECGVVVVAVSSEPAGGQGCACEQD